MTDTGNVARGLRAMAQRSVNAENAFVRYAMSNAGLTSDKALQVLDYYLKHKLVKLDVVMGTFKVQHGTFLDADVLQRCADEHCA